MHHLKRATYSIAVLAFIATERLSGQVLAFDLIDLAFGVWVVSSNSSDFE